MEGETVNDSDWILPVRMAGNGANAIVLLGASPGLMDQMAPVCFITDMPIRCNKKWTWISSRKEMVLLNLSVEFHYWPTLSEVVVVSKHLTTDRTNRKIHCKGPGKHSPHWFLTLTRFAPIFFFQNVFQSHTSQRLVHFTNNMPSRCHHSLVPVQCDGHFLSYFPPVPRY